EKGLKRIAWVFRHFVTRFVLEFRILARNWKNLKGLDALIVSGGGQLDDYWGGPFSHPFTLLKWSIASRLRGAYLFFVSVGAGPIRSKLSFVFIKRALLLGHYRTFRDEGSKALLGTLGFHSDDPVFPDIAHSIDIDFLGIDTQPTRAKRTIGIGPMSYFKQSFWPAYDDAIYGKYLGSLAGFLAWANANGYVLRFFPGEAGADTHAIRDLTNLLTQEYGISPDSLICSQVETVEALLREISSTDIIVASRFHGVLLAHVLGKPVVALSYHPKIDHIMKNIGHEKYCLDIRSFTADALQSAFVNLEQNLTEAQRQVSLVEASYREQLSQQYERIIELIGR
ncbi:MAG: polysaccharide pyruvyl transferase family protein, partial [Ignavibacteria bacterium]|nr:polysaccharide pyruvyl transferase family protein [Ignavibacteria bacterium]